MKHILKTYISLAQYSLISFKCAPLIDLRLKPLPSVHPCFIDLFTTPNLSYVAATKPIKSYYFILTPWRDNIKDFVTIVLRP